MSQISNREIIAARIGYMTQLPKEKQLEAIEIIKVHALELGFTDAEFEEFFLELVHTVWEKQAELLAHLKNL